MIFDSNTDLIQHIMSDFSERTGLTGTSHSPVRYLWTDAFAVCNFLGLYIRSGELEHLYRATRLVDQVHEMLGRHRADDPHEGWISGLSEEEGRRHPTAGGLRIGKPRGERSEREPLDERTEWDRDGQYYHYLTKWMDALDRVGELTGDRRYSLWAVELAKAAHAGFVSRSAAGEPLGMYWKASIDLSRPLVPHMGQPDPLDGLVTLRQLAFTDMGDGVLSSPDLDREIKELESLCTERSWSTVDPLGIGGLLTDALHLGQLEVLGPSKGPDLLGSILRAAVSGLREWKVERPLERGAAARLPFRELGLSIGLQAIRLLQALVRRAPEVFVGRPMVSQSLERLAPFVPLADRIHAFWLDPEHQRIASWSDHLDINSVMLATSLGPDAYLRKGWTPRAADSRDMLNR